MFAAKKSGILLCAYRNMDENNKGVGCSLSFHGGHKWTETKMINESNEFNCGYPSLLNLENGDIMCIYYTEYDEKGDCYDGATITRYEMKQPKPVYHKRVWRTGRNR